MGNEGEIEERMNLSTSLHARTRAVCVGLLLVACGADSRGQTATTGTDPQGVDQSIYPMHATVTKAMGDVGGKYFGKVPDPAKTKHYYIAAEPVIWDFAPGGADEVCGKTFPDALLLNRSSYKIRYVQYADANFSARVLPQERLGILGRCCAG